MEEMELYTSNKYAQNKWETINDKEEVQYLKENDHYNESHGLKHVIGEYVQTILQYIFQTTPLHQKNPTFWNTD